MIKIFLIILITYISHVKPSETSYFGSYDFSLFSSKVFLDSENKTLTVLQKNYQTNFPTYLGKGFLNIIDSFRNKNYQENITLVIDTNENLQFLIYYTIYPPNQPPLIPTTSKWTYNFTKNSNFYQIFSLITTSKSDANGELNSCAFFHNVIKVILPKHGLKLLKKRIKILRLSLNSLELNIQDIALVESLLNTINTYLNSLIIEETNQTLSKNQSKNPPKTTLSHSIFKLSHDDDMLYSFSDETSHFWLNSLKNYLFIVDAGSQVMAGILNKTINIPQTVHNVNIFITHCHYDHIQSLATFINKNHQLNITVYIHLKIAFELMGWLLESYFFLIDSNNKFLFKLVIINDNSKTFIADANLWIQAIQHYEFEKNDIKHFVPSTTWAFFEYKKCMKIFSGDLNPPMPKPNNSILSNQIKNYFEQIYQRITGEENCVNYFWDYGHFFDRNENYYETLQSFDKSKADGNVLKSGFYYEHYKNESGFSIYKVRLPREIEGKNQFYVFPPEYNAEKQKMVEFVDISRKIGESNKKNLRRKIKDFFLNKEIGKEG